MITADHHLLKQRVGRDRDQAKRMTDITIKDIRITAMMIMDITTNAGDMMILGMGLPRATGMRGPTRSSGHHHSEVATEGLRRNVEVMVHRREEAHLL